MAGTWQADLLMQQLWLTLPAWGGALDCFWGALAGALPMYWFVCVGVCLAPAVWGEGGSRPFYAAVAHLAGVERYVLASSAAQLFS